MPRPEPARTARTTAKITPPPAREPYRLPKPWTLRSIPEGYILVAANGNEAMRFLATSNMTDFPEGRTLAEAKQHAERVLEVLGSNPAEKHQ